MFQSDLLFSGKIYRQAKFEARDSKFAKRMVCLGMIEITRMEIVFLLNLKLHRGRLLLLTM